MVAVLATSEEKVHFPTETVAKRREDWTVERDWLNSEKDAIRAFQVVAPCKCAKEIRPSSANCRSEMMDAIT